MTIKIAIMTFNRAFNYGGDLQCFALQYKLRQMGYNVDVLDVLRPVHQEYIHNVEDSKRFRTLYSYNERYDVRSTIKEKLFKLIEKIFSLIYYKRNRRRNRDFKDFHDKYIKFSNNKFRSFSHLYNNIDKMHYTHYIAGSDQVWNYTYPFSVEPYFLTFVKEGVKISYAASIGHSNIPDKIKLCYKKWLSDFSYISLREDKGVEIIKKITHRKDIVHALDPSLLLSKLEWIESLDLKDPIHCNNKSQKKYVLVYLLSQSNYSIKIAYEIAKKKSCSVKLVTSNLFATYLKRNCQFITARNPKTFVSLFIDAEFVITNSFHGTAFAINFNIPFYATTRKSKRVNSRFNSLLSICSLNDRLIFEGDNLTFENIENINFDAANIALMQERSKSLSFLKTALK